MSEKLNLKEFIEKYSKEDKTKALNIKAKLRLLRKTFYLSLLSIFPVLYYVLISLINKEVHAPYFQISICILILVLTFTLQDIPYLRPIPQDIVNFEEAFWKKEKTAMLIKATGFSFLMLTLLLFNTGSVFRFFLTPSIIFYLLLFTLERI